MAISVVQYDLSGIFIKEWESAKQAAEYLKINRSAINNCVNKKSKTSNNFIWKRK